MSTREPRIAPGTLSDVGLLNGALAHLLGLASGGPAPNVFLTLGRHRSLFRKWLWFAGGLMPGGTLRRRESELVILSVAHSMGCAYEWDHHERLAKRAGVSAEAIASVRRGELDAACLTPRERAFLRASHELFVGVRDDEAVLCATSDEGWSWHSHDVEKDHYVYRRDEVAFWGEPVEIDGYFYVDLPRALRLFAAFFEDPGAALATTDWEIE